MAATIRFRSGDMCTQPGRFSFDGYEDGAWDPPPRLEEMEVEIKAGDRFPVIRSADKACWWVAFGEDEEAEAREAMDFEEEEEEERMTSEGGPVPTH